jgi:hypothetical protein
MKFLKGLHSDNHPSVQPEGTYRSARNLVLSDEIINEPGNQSTSFLTGGYKPIGHVVLPNNRIIVFSASPGGGSEIGVIWSDGKYYRLVNDPRLNFSPDHPIDAIAKLSSLRQQDGAGLDSAVEVLFSEALTVLEETLLSVEAFSPSPSPSPSPAGLDAPENFVLAVEKANQYGLLFDGTNDFVGMSDPINIANSRTISLWLYVDSAGVGSARIILGNREDSPSAAGYRMRMNSDGRLFCFHTGVGDANITSTDPLPTNQWIHVAWVTDGANGAKLYVNFVEVASIATSSDAIASSTNFSLGQNYGGSTYWMGKMDEVQIWSAALTLEEIQAAAETPLEGDEAGLANYWRFEEGSGTTAADSAGAINGTISGARYITDVPFTLFRGTCSWDAVAGADSYDIYLNKDGAGFVKENDDPIIGTTFDTGELANGDYLAHVVAVAGVEQSPSSNEEEFGIFYTNFSGYTATQKPSDWTYRWDDSESFADLWKVQTDAEAAGGQVLRYPTQVVNANRLISWDLVGTVADVELEMRVKGYTLTTGNNRSRQWLLARGGGNVSTRDGYSNGFLMDSGGSTRETYKFVSGATTLLSSASITIAVEEWWIVKLRVVGTDLQIKVWKEGDAEPAFTTISDSDVSAAGWAGIAANLRGQVDIDWFKAIKL